jgi:hypothetical protein
MSLFIPIKRTTVGLSGQEMDKLVGNGKKMASRTRKYRLGLT